MCYSANWLRKVLAQQGVILERLREERSNDEKNVRERTFKRLPLSSNAAQKEKATVDRAPVSSGRSFTGIHVLTIFGSRSSPHVFAYRGGAHIGIK